MAIHKSKKSRKSHSAVNTDSQKGIMIQVIRGTVIGAIAYFSMMAIMSFIMTKNDFGDTAVLLISIFIGAFSAFIASVTAVRKIGKKGAVLGAISALPISLMAFLFIAIANKGSMGYNIFFLIFGMPFCGSLGGILAVNMRRA